MPASSGLESGASSSPVDPNRIRYKTGYKHQLAETVSFSTRFRPGERVSHEWVTLDTNGTLTIRSGYCWDGASGPTIDDDVFLHASLIHDALYQLMRHGLLPSDRWRDADHEMRRHIDRRLKTAPWYSRSFWAARIHWVMAGLKLAAGGAARSDSKREVKEA